MNAGSNGRAASAKNDSIYIKPITRNSKMNNFEAVKAIGELINQVDNIKDHEKDWSRLQMWRKCVTTELDAIFADADVKKSEFGRISYDVGGFVQYVTEKEAQTAFENGLQNACEYLSQLKEKLMRAGEDSMRWKV